MFIFVCFLVYLHVFVLFGRQILKQFPESRVLACAPSNSAADLVLQRVMEHTVIPKSQMMRLNAFGRSALSLPKDIKVCYKHNHSFELSWINNIMKWLSFDIQLYSDYSCSLVEVSSLQDVCCITSGGDFFMPSKEAIMEKRLVVSTLITAGRLLVLHFSLFM